jgi:hypothetical protein
METSESFSYPADVESVFQLLGDEEFLKEKYSSLGQRDFTITAHEESEDGRRLSTTRVVDSDIPSFAKLILGATNTLVQTEEWFAPEAGGARNGRWAVEISGSPVRMGGTLRLEPQGEHCVYQISVAVTASVPLIGGKIADFAGGQAVDLLRQENRFSAEWLARRS